MSIGTKGTFDFDISIREEEAKDQLQKVQRDDERGAGLDNKNRFGKRALLSLDI
jgi:hypothetical protein